MKDNEITSYAESLQDYMVEMRRAWLREQGYTDKQIQDMPLNGRPKDPGLPIDTGAISAVGRQLLIICGCRERSYWDGVRTLMADDPDTTVSGSRLMDVTAYILRRDFASWVSNVCAIPNQELDIAMGHKVKVSMKRDIPLTTGRKRPLQTRWRA